MQVRTFIGASAAYACIATETTSLDIRLNPGRSAAQSLRETAADWRAEAWRILRRAELAEAAALQLVPQLDSDDFLRACGVAA